MLGGPEGQRARSALITHREGRGRCVPRRLHLHPCCARDFPRDEAVRVSVERDQLCVQENLLHRYQQAPGCTIQAG